MRTWQQAVLGVVIVAVCGVMLVGCPPGPPTRTFYMSFTQWPYDSGAEAIGETFDLIRPNSDMLSFHFDEGVPWPEAFAGGAYNPNYEGFLSLMLEEREGADTVYLALSSLNPGRTNLADYRGAEGNLPRPAPWNGFGFAFEDVVFAYSNFCLEMITRFQPKFFNYAIDATELYFENPALWALYVDFNAQVYANIKARHPALMVGISVPLRNPGDPQSETLRARVNDLHPYFDFLGVGIYPYAFFGPQVTGNPATLEKGWLSQAVRMARGKPVAIAETGWIAEDLVVNSFGISIPGRPEWQDAYVNRLLLAAEEINALFVVWYTVADYDRLLAGLPEELLDVIKIWRDTGLYDENLNARPALATWQQFLATGPGPE